MVMAPNLFNSIPFFNGLSDETLAELLQTSRTADFSAGQTLLRNGDKPNNLIIVLAGIIQLNELADDGRVISISYAGSNDLLAWLSIIDNKPTSQTIVTASASKVLICPIDLVQKLVANNALVANRFLSLAANSIRRIEQARALLSLPNAFHRVFVQISLLSADAKSGATSLPKQQDIANAVNTSRETVSRALQMLIKKGVLHKVGHQIVIRHPDKLQMLAMDGPEAMITD